MDFLENLLKRAFSMSRDGAPTSCLGRRDVRRTKPIERAALVPAGTQVCPCALVWTRVNASVGALGRGYSFMSVGALWKCVLDILSHVVSVRCDGVPVSVRACICDCVHANF